MLAYLLLHFERLVSGPAAVDDAVLGGLTPADPQLLAIFAHDFNLLYMRRLLRLSWVTASFPPHAVPTGSSLSFELHADHEGTGCAEHRRGCVRGVAADAVFSWQVPGARRAHGSDCGAAAELHFLAPAAGAA